MKPTRDDLRVPGTHNHYGDHYRKVTPDDLEQMGLVQRPSCTGCGGSGKSQCQGEYPSGAAHTHKVPCPKCGGSGYGRLVSLDVDVEALRDLRGSLVYLSDPNSRDSVALIDQVLAALDGETT